MRCATPRQIVAVALALFTTLASIHLATVLHAERDAVVGEFPVDADVEASLQAVPTSASLRLYILDCGTLRNRDAVPYGLSLEQVSPRDLSNVCALVVHPRGTLLWETGLNESVNRLAAAADSRPGRPRAGDHIDRTLASQLAEIGYEPGRISFLALSHAHWDHTGNVRDFLGATWLVQKAERESIFGTMPLPNQEDFAGIDRSKAIVLEGDHDVFGDGSVRLILTPGHTPGHQALFVRLPMTGGVILSGDLYHFAEELTMPLAEGRNAVQSSASKARIQALVAETGAQLWIQHDARHFAKLRKAPEYYQ
jgi:glyoxylase-like metal-dependent hydrolase (beta-lactamase superfamily II)